MTRRSSPTADFDDALRRLAELRACTPEAAEGELWEAWRDLVDGGATSSLPEEIADLLRAWAESGTWAADQSPVGVALCRRLGGVIASYAPEGPVLDMSGGLLAAGLVESGSVDPGSVILASPEPAELVKASVRMQIAGGEPARSARLWGPFVEPEPQRGLFEGPPSGLEPPKFRSAVVWVGGDVLAGRDRERARRRFRIAERTSLAAAPRVARLVELLPADGRLFAAMPLKLLRRTAGEAFLAGLLESSPLEEIVRVGVLDEEWGVLVFGSARTGRVRVRWFEPDARDVLPLDQVHYVPRTTDDVLRALAERAVRQLEARVEDAAKSTVRDLVSRSPGRTTACGELDVWLVDERWSKYARGLVGSEDIQGWRVVPSRRVIWPYEAPGRPFDILPERLEDHLRPYRRLLEQRLAFGRTMGADHWHEHAEHYPDRLADGHRLCVRAYGRRVEAARAPVDFAYTRSAPVFHFDDEVSLYLVLGLLNSAFASAWIQHHAYTNTSGNYELTLDTILDFPLPADGRETIVESARRLDKLARSHATIRIDPESSFEDVLRRYERILATNREVRRKMVAAQETLDLRVAVAFGLVASDIAGEEFRVESPDERLCCSDDPPAWYRAALGVEAYREIERPRFKREWPVDESSSEELRRAWLRARLFAWAEAREGQSFRASEALDALVPEGESDAEVLRDILEASAVEGNPWRLFTREGVEKWKGWRRGTTPSPGLTRANLADDRVGRRAADRAWALRGALGRQPERLILLGELSEITEEPHYTWRAADPAVRAQVHIDAVEIAWMRSFAPPKAGEADPRLWGLLGGAVAEIEGIRARDGESGARHIVDVVEGLLGSRIKRAEEMYLKEVARGPMSRTAEATTQLDLARMLDLESWIATCPGDVSMREAADAMLSKGWRFVETRRAFDALVAAGRLVPTPRKGRWRIVKLP